MLSRTVVDTKRKISLLRFLFMSICIIGASVTLILLFTVPDLEFIILTCLMWGAIAITSRYIYHKIELLKLEVQRISTVDEPYQQTVYTIQEPVKQVVDQYPPNQPMPDPQQPYQGYPPQPVYNAYPPPPGIYAVYPRAHGEFVVDNPPPQPQPQPKNLSQIQPVTKI